MLEIRILHMFPRPGVQRDYWEDEKDIFVCVAIMLPLVLIVRRSNAFNYR